MLFFFLLLTFDFRNESYLNFQLDSKIELEKSDNLVKFIEERYKNN